MTKEQRLKLRDIVRVHGAEWVIRQCLILGRPKPLNQVRAWRLEFVTIRKIALEGET